MEDDTQRWLGDGWKFYCEKGQWPHYQEGSRLLVCVGIKEIMKNAAAVAGIRGQK